MCWQIAIYPPRDRMPFNCNLIFNNALACHRAGQLQQAAKLYRQILNIDRDHAQASNNLGAIFMTLAV